MSTPDPELLRLAREAVIGKEKDVGTPLLRTEIIELLAAFVSSPEVREYLDWKNLSRPLPEL